MVMTGRKITRVGELLPSLLNKLGLEQRFKEQQILELWPAVAGEELASRTKATRFARGVLYVYVDHGAWMQELHFVEKALINKLCARAPGVAIKKIRFSSRDTT